jgi:hypothetical protein
MSSVHNYYDRLVFDAVSRHARENAIRLSQDQYEDIACLALNRLPPRYVRFDVDTTFYLSQEDLKEINTLLNNAVRGAFAIVLEDN